MLQPIDKLQLQTISTCNANCVFCPYIESWHKANPGKMEHKLFVKILNEMEEYDKFNTFCPYFMNEPLTDSRVFTWMKEFYDKYPNKKVEISVNPGYLIKKNRKKLISTFKDKSHSILVSFHGMNETSLRYIMGLDFSTSLNNIVSLIKESKDSLDLVIRGAGTSIDNKIFYFSGGHYITFWKDVFEDNDIPLDRVGVQTFGFHDRAGQLDRKERDSYLNKHGVVREIGPNNPFNCVRFDKVLHVLYNGDIAPCCMDYKKEIPWLGNLNDMTITEYFESDPYKKWIDMGTGKIKSLNEFICKRCISPGG